VSGGGAWDIQQQSGNPGRDRGSSRNCDAMLRRAEGRRGRANSSRVQRRRARRRAARPVASAASVRARPRAQARRVRRVNRMQLHLAHRMPRARRSTPGARAPTLRQPRNPIFASAATWRRRKYPSLSTHVRETHTHRGTTAHTSLGTKRTRERTSARTYGQSNERTNERTNDRTDVDRRAHSSGIVRVRCYTRARRHSTGRIVRDACHRRCTTAHGSQCAHTYARARARAVAGAEEGRKKKKREEAHSRR